MCKFEMVKIPGFGLMPTTRGVLDCLKATGAVRSIEVSVDSGGNYVADCIFDESGRREQYTVTPDEVARHRKRFMAGGKVAVPDEALGKLLATKKLINSIKHLWIDSFPKP